MKKLLHSTLTLFHHLLLGCYLCIRQSIYTVIEEEVENACYNYDYDSAEDVAYLSIQSNVESELSEIDSVLMATENRPSITATDQILNQLSSIFRIKYGSCQQVSNQSIPFVGTRFAKDTKSGACLIQF